MGVQVSREKRMQVFKDTMRRCSTEGELAEAVQCSMEHTVLYREPVVELAVGEWNRFDVEAEIFVTENRTLQAVRNACRDYPEARVGILSFASAVNPGGGAVNGTSGQEEDICRCSTLYPCLRLPYLMENYYQYHRARKDNVHSNRCVYVPDVIVFKVDTPECGLESERCRMDVISCAAPDLRKNRYAQQSGREVSLPETGLRELFRTRMEGIVRIAAYHRMDVLILGAFGCGVFGNCPLLVAECFREVLKDFRYAFRRVEFAVCSPSEGDGNYQSFGRVLGTR